MVLTDKQSIYVPEEVKKTLENDARLFEVLHEDGQLKGQKNMNDLINRIIQGYYETYTEYCSDLRENIRSVLSDYIFRENELQNAVNEMFSGIERYDDNYRKGPKQKISFRPSNDSQDVIFAIQQQMNGTGDGPMKYISRMLIRYSGNPIYERERIVYRKTYTELLRCCKRKTPVVFITKLNKRSHTVLPYRISVNNEEMANYLLCQEYDSRKKRYEAKSYRLSRVTSLRQDVTSHQVLQEDVKKHLDLTDRYASQYAINSDELICVSLSEAGVDLYNRIYTSRPVPREIVKEGDRYLYSFDCSMNQINLYFRRFEKDAAVILTPKRLRDGMIAFHSGVVKAYGKIGQ